MSMTFVHYTKTQSVITTIIISAARDQVLARESTAEHHKEVFLALEKGESPADIAKRFGLSAAGVRQIGHRIRTAVQTLIGELA